jgi:hypothetical protein
MPTKNLPLGTVCGTGTLMQPQFAPGMLLQHDDLMALGTYARDLNRLLFRSLFGCGVVCGLKVAVQEKCGKIVVTIDPGVALDCCGDPIQVPVSRTITIDPQCNQKIRSPLYVVLCEKNKCCAPRAAMCAADDGDSTSVCTREKYGFEIKIVADRPDCACGCPDPAPDRGPNYPQAASFDEPCRCANPDSECYKDHYNGVCGCDCCDTGEDCTCDCKCLLLALLYSAEPENASSWKVDHRVRRFVRPVLIADPVVRQEAMDKAKAAAQQNQVDPDPLAVGAGLVALLADPQIVIP